MIVVLIDDNGKSVSADVERFAFITIGSLTKVLLTGKCRNKELINDCKDTECRYFGDCIYKIKENDNG